MNYFFLWHNIVARFIFVVVFFRSFSPGNRLLSCYPAAYFLFDMEMVYKQHYPAMPFWKNNICFFNQSTRRMQPKTDRFQ